MSLRHCLHRILALHVIISTDIELPSHKSLPVMQFDGLLSEDRWCSHKGKIALKNVITRRPKVLETPQQWSTAAMHPSSSLQNFRWIQTARQLVRIKANKSNHQKLVSKHDTPNIIIRVHIYTYACPSQVMLGPLQSNLSLDADKNQ